MHCARWVPAATAATAIVMSACAGADLASLASLRKGSPSPTPSASPTAAPDATASPSPSPDATPTPSTIVLRLGMELQLSQTKQSIYQSSYFNLTRGTDTALAGLADIHFVVASGVPFLVGLGTTERAFSFKVIEGAQFIAVREAPESGYTLGANTSGVTDTGAAPYITSTQVASGKVYAFRIETPSGSTFGKVGLTSISSSKVLFDYAFQTATGSRLVEDRPEPTPTPEPSPTPSPSPTPAPTLSPTPTPTPSPTPKMTVTTFAGGGSPDEYLYQDGTGLTARFGPPRGVAVDSTDRIFVTDPENLAIRIVSQESLVTPLLPKGSGRTLMPAVTQDGLVYTPDDGCHDVRIVNFNGTNARTLTGICEKGYADGATPRFSGPTGIAAGPGNTLYVTDQDTCVRKISGGQTSTFAGVARTYGLKDGTGSNALFSSPFGIAVDASGNVFVADGGNSAIRKITPDRVVSTLVTGLKGPRGVALDKSGNIAVAEEAAHRVSLYSPAGTLIAFAGGTSGNVDGVGPNAKFSYPQGLAFDSKGVLYVADFGNHTVRRVTITSP